MIKFYKDIQLIQFCKECGVKFYPDRFSWQARLRLCIKHRRIFSNEKIKRLFDNLPPERQAEIRKKNIEDNKKWVAKNPERRREIARDSERRRRKLRKV